MRNERRFSEEVLPEVFARLDTVFPEFGWVRRHNGWVATNDRFSHERLNVRCDRVICNNERGYYIHGSRQSEHWLAYLNGGVFPSGDAWLRTASELASRVGLAGFAAPRPRPVSVWERVLEAARAQMASPAGEACRAYCDGRGLPWRSYGLGCVADRDQLLAAAELTPSAARQLRVLTSRPGEDWWTSRVIGGVFDDGGEVIGLWGRATSSSGKSDKYIISGEPGPFVLGPLSGQRVVVVEGFLDAHRVHAVTGLSVVAAGGTGVTQTTLRLLEDADDVVVAFDPDDAGEAGRKRLVKQLVTWSGPPVSFVDGSDEGADIDVELRDGGIERWNELVSMATPWLTYATQRELESKAVGSADEVASLRRVGAICKAALERWPLDVAVALREVGRVRALDERFLLRVLETVSDETVST